MSSTSERLAESDEPKDLAKKELKKELKKEVVDSTKNETEDLIKKEAVENKSTTPAIIQYFKACNMKLVIIYFSMYLFSYVAQIVSNLWFNDLSNKYERYSNKMDKLYNYGIYFLLGFASCN